MELESVVSNALASRYSLPGFSDLVHDVAKDPRELPLKRLALPVSLRDLWEVEQGEDFCRANIARLLSLLARTSIEQLELVIPELFPSAVDGCSVNSIKELKVAGRCSFKDKVN